jgi:hypothetical protein
MTIRIAYRHSPSSGLPESLSRQEIWNVASSLRQQLVHSRGVRQLAVEEIPDRARRLEVNGIAFEVDWDLEHPVHRAGRPVLGVTDYDKASPGSVLVSINGPKLRSDELLRRSTIAHETGHVMFEGPGWIRVPPDVPVRSSFSQAKGSRDPREVRANEFMGALLVPPSLLRVDVMRIAKKHQLVPSRRPSSVLPRSRAYDARANDCESVDDAVFELAEVYGVSESFMRVRLNRYDLLRVPLNND